MLHYVEFGLSYMEVPGEAALCIYISGCSNRCVNCHYQELQQVDAGELLATYFEQILDLYHDYTTCVCFMGEGDGSEESRTEMLSCVKSCNKRAYKTCLYSGRDTNIEDWMKPFDYVKVGSYREEFGPLTSETTNQRMWMKEADRYIDITEKFGQMQQVMINERYC